MFGFSIRQLGLPASESNLLLSLPPPAFTPIFLSVTHYLVCARPSNSLSNTLSMRNPLSDLNCPPLLSTPVTLSTPQKTP
ncbi:hypothetical protein Hypma_006075 [Hypsizygus marmoreus]|uniref:Uncharacterized protein n=1 Tax=Hypsizygus marmoreus TaxID=39966 RepID=A0A369K5T3_HYPMA|nr:hypothetical protein Hypma_006075 [Hypsizygus marmoreus]